MRRPVGKGKSRRKFVSRAAKTSALNLRGGTPRGGVRL